jgi:hypothetical protein
MSFRRHWNMRFGVLLSCEKARIGLAVAKGATTRMRRQLGTTDTGAPPYRGLCLTSSY